MKKTLPAGTATDAAWTITSTLLGAVQLARALVDGEPKAAQAVLTDTRRNLLARYDT